MKKLFAIAGALFAASVLFAADVCFLVELDGRYRREKFAEIKADAGRLSKAKSVEGKGEFYNIYGTTPLTSEWQSFSFSFVPNSKSVTLGFRSFGKNIWVDYDDIKVENGGVYNPSFEVINNDKEIDGWRYYAPKSMKAGMKDAADGENYVTCASQHGMRQRLNLIPGKQVTVTFKARIGQAVEVPPSLWTSSGQRKVR